MNISSDYFIFINILIAIIYIVFIFIGYSKGFLYELISLFYSLISGLVSWFLSPVLANVYPIIQIDNLNSETELLSKFIDLSTILNTLIYFILIFLILKLLYILIALILKGMNSVPVIGKFNQILGIFAGIFNATLITLCLSMLLTLPIFKNGDEIKNGTIFKYVSEYSDKVLTYIVDNVYLDNVKRQFDDFDIDNARKEFKYWIESKKNNE